MPFWVPGIRGRAGLSKNDRKATRTPEWPEVRSNGPFLFAFTLTFILIIFESAGITLPFSLSNVVVHLSAAHGTFLLQVRSRSWFRSCPLFAFFSVLLQFRRPELVQERLYVRLVPGFCPGLQPFLILRMRRKNTAIFSQQGNSPFVRRTSGIFSSAPKPESAQEKSNLRLVLVFCFELHPFPILRMRRKNTATFSWSWRSSFARRTWGKFSAVLYRCARIFDP